MRKRLVAAMVVVSAIATLLMTPGARATHGYQPAGAAPCPNRNTALRSPSNPFGVTRATGLQDYDKPGVVHPDVVADEGEQPRVIRCVHVGGGDIYRHANPHNGNFLLTRFYPDVIKVHRGDILEFRPAPGWAGTTHAPGVFEAPHASGRSPLEPAVDELVRRDESPGVIAFNHGIATGSGLGDEACGLKYGSRSHGINPQKPCVVSGVPNSARFDVNEMFTNVGRPQPFWIEVDLPPGTYSYHCTYHSWMVGRIEVVADHKKVPSHEEVAKEALRMAAADIAEAEALHRELSEPTWRQDGDRRVWRVTSGANTDSGHASIIGYMPASLRVRRGDRVKFVGGRPDAPTLVGRTAEAQTVTFPGESVGAFFLEGCTFSDCDGSVWYDDLGPPPGPYEDRIHTQAVPHGLALPVFPWACDYDDWNGGSPGVPKSWVPRAGCPLGPVGERGKFEFLFSDLAARSQRAPGDQIVSKSTLHNSGWMVPAAYSWPNRPLDDPTWEDDPTWPTEFSAEFPNADTFNYACLLHPDVMTGAIRVEG